MLQVFWVNLFLCLSHPQAKLQEAWTWGISLPPTKATPDMALTGSALKEATWRRMTRMVLTLRMKSIPLRRPQCPRPNECRLPVLLLALSGCTLNHLCNCLYRLLKHFIFCVKMLSLRPTTATLIYDFKGPQGDTKLWSFWG